jgi:hypothetical protein
MNAAVRTESSTSGLEFLKGLFIVPQVILKYVKNQDCLLANPYQLLIYDHIAISLGPYMTWLYCNCNVTVNRHLFLTN